MNSHVREVVVEVSITKLCGCLYKHSCVPTLNLHNTLLVSQKTCLKQNSMRKMHTWLFQVVCDSGACKSVYHAVSTMCVWLPNQVVMQVFKRFVTEVLEEVSVTELCGYL